MARLLVFGRKFGHYNGCNWKYMAHFLLLKMDKGQELGEGC
ncbi:hypothetical protein Vi05172_g8672 [Venturia inaequalis]|nr:hypothetical protein Vi05172_g8672 [Venturia inaequalis]